MTNRFRISSSADGSTWTKVEDSENYFWAAKQARERSKDGKLTVKVSRIENDDVIVAFTGGMPDTRYYDANRFR